MNANLYTSKDKNVWKTWGFMVFFLSLVIAVGWFFSYLYRDASILYIAVAFAVLINIFSYWFSDRIVLGLHRAKPVTRQEYFDLWNMTENLSIAAGLPMPKLYIIEDSSPNAFATGRDKNHAVVAVTTGLVALLKKEELEGVIAHELAHIGNRDMLLSTIVVVMVGFIAIISDFFLRSQILGGMRSGGEGNRAGGIMVIIGIALAILAPLAAMLIRLAISRKREFLADASGAMLTRYPEGLANALKKISSSPAPLRSAHDATAHLFFSNPFGAKKLSGLHRLFMTHPPTEDRIRALVGKSIK